MITFIALGSNIGDRTAFVDRALKEISNRVGEIKKEATLIETEPYGVTDQDKFLNTVIKVDTKLKPRELLNELLKIEKDLGRERRKVWGPRKIDLDIIYYENEIIDEDDLHIPHIDLHNRDFVLGPLVEIEKDFVDPRQNKTVYQLYNELKAKN